MIDPYKILGLAPGASAEDAKAAFRKLAKTCHPDLHPNDSEAEKKFKEINEAYEQIKDGKPNLHHGFPRHDFGFTSFDDLFSNRMDNIFSELRARQQNPNVHLECTLTLEEAFNGKEISVQLNNRTANSRHIQAFIPPGLRDGMRISIPNGGVQTNPAYPAGNLFITVKIAPHNVFSRDSENNLICTIKVPIFDALVGNTFNFKGIDGKDINVSIPANFDSSHKIRVAGQGMPDPHTKVRGDLFVGISFLISEITEEQKNMIKGMMQKQN